MTSQAKPPVFSQADGLSRPEKLPASWRISFRSGGTRVARTALALFPMHKRKLIVMRHIATRAHILASAWPLLPEVAPLPELANREVKKR